MSENAGQFRGAAFGGFHRQDVLDYLEQITLEHQREKEALEQTIEAQRAQADQDQDDRQAALAQAREEASQAKAQLAAAQAELTAREAETAGLKEELELTRTLLAEAEAQAAELREKVKALTPEAQAWKRIRDTAGDIEVGAHERAQITIQTAQIQAAELKADGVRWILDIQSRCDRLKRDLHTSLVSAEAELDTVRTAFRRAEEDMEGVQAALSDLMAGATGGGR